MYKVVLAGLASALIVISSSAATQESQPELIPLEYLAMLPTFSEPALAPNGKYVAAAMTVLGDPRVVVQRLFAQGEKGEPELQQIDLGKQFFSGFEWANDDRLLISVRSTIGSRGDLINMLRLGSIGRDGSNPVIFDMSPNDWGYYRQHAYMVNPVVDDNDHILAALDDHPDKFHEPDIHKVNVYTGKRQLVGNNRKGIYRWIADDTGALRIGVRYDMAYGKKRSIIYYRETSESDWQELQRADILDNDRLEPYRFDKDDPNILLITTDELEDNAILDETEENFYRYDLTTRKIIGPYVNEEQLMIQKSVEKALPDKTVKFATWDEAHNLIIFRVYTDVMSPEYYLLDRSAGSMQYLAAEYPKLNQYNLSAMQKISYAARDGLEIPAYLTIPAHAKNDQKLPFIIFPHGGPWARDQWGFDNYVQFFADRGYGVFQPQFRGSTGFGIEHLEAGYEQWGYAIQDDITDGVNWVIEQGYADPARICIVGSSFGGYAAAVGLSKTPELYACGISVNGVMDLKMLVDSTKKSFFGNIDKAVWNPRSETKDASPYHLSNNITAPLLLIASERDTVVPAKHSKRMYKRMKGDKQQVEYVELPDGEHWRTTEKLELKKFQAMEKFLARYLKPNTN